VVGFCVPGTFVPECGLGTTRYGLRIMVGTTFRCWLELDHREGRKKHPFSRRNKLTTYELEHQFLAAVGNRNAAAVEGAARRSGHGRRDAAAPGSSGAASPRQVFAAAAPCGLVISSECSSSSRRLNERSHHVNGPPAQCEIK